MTGSTTIERPFPALRARRPSAKAAVIEPGRWWAVDPARGAAGVRNPRRSLRALIDRLIATPGVDLYDAVEAGVPTRTVDLIAAATGETVARVMDLVGVSPTTFRRKAEAGEPLPEEAGHRVMAYLRLLATLKRLLDESGDRDELAAFDLEGWFAAWLRDPRPELGGKTPAQMLRNPEGQRALEQLLERMRGGLPA